MKQVAKKYPWLITALTAAVMVAIIVTVNTGDNVLLDAMIRVVLGIIAFAITAYAFDVNCLRPGKGSIRTTIRFSWLIFLIPVITLVSAGAMAVIDQTVNPDLVSEAVKNLALTAGIGIFEEALFRGVVVVGLIHTFRKSKHVFAITAVVSSLFFGFVHIMFDLDFSSGFVMAQCILKTLEAASHGLLFLLIFCKTRSLIGAVISHMLYDYAGILSSCIMVSSMAGTAQVGGYVSTNAARGTAGIGILGVTALVGIIAVVIILKKHLPKHEREAFIGFITGEGN